MQGLQQLVAFAATARHGNFAAAARDQGVASSTMAKAVARLEASLGVRLFHRTTRQVTLTPDGERLYERCERVLAELEDLRAAATGTRTEPTGTLRVEMPVFYGKRYVLPILGQLLRRYPSLRLEARLDDMQADLVRDNIDLAVRIGPLRDSTLVARRVDSQGLCLCASAAYLAERGVPRRIEDLVAHDAIVFRLPTSGRDRPWQLRQRGQTVELQPQAHVRVTETEGLVAALELGLGLCQLPRMVVADALAGGALVEVLASHRPAPMPIHVVHPPGRLLPARVRVALEALDALRDRREQADGPSEAPGVSRPPNAARDRRRGTGRSRSGR